MRLAQPDHRPETLPNRAFVPGCRSAGSKAESNSFKDSEELVLCPPHLLLLRELRNGTRTGFSWPLDSSGGKIICYRFNRDVAKRTDREHNSSYFPRGKITYTVSILNCLVTTHNTPLNGLIAVQDELSEAEMHRCQVRKLFILFNLLSPISLLFG